MPLLVRYEPLGRAREHRSSGGRGHFTRGGPGRWPEPSTPHGCVNASPAAAEWFYDFSQPGDVFEVRNTGGEPLQLSQNGDWSLSWEQWRAGSALA